MSVQNASPAPWHRIEMSRDEFESGASEVLRAVFHAGFIACNGPPGAALFGGWSHDRESFLFYLTPTAERCAAALMRVYGAKPCGRPIDGAIAWLSGDPGGFAGDGYAF